MASLKATFIAAEKAADAEWRADNELRRAEFTAEMKNLNVTSVTAGNAADGETAVVPATTTAQIVAHSIATDITSGDAVTATAATNLFVDSKINPTKVHVTADNAAAAAAAVTTIGAENIKKPLPLLL